MLKKKDKLIVHKMIMEKFENIPRDLDGKMKRQEVFMQLSYFRLNRVDIHYVIDELIDLGYLERIDKQYVRLKNA